MDSGPRKASTSAHFGLTAEEQARGCSLHLDSPSPACLSPGRHMWRGKDGRVSRGHRASLAKRAAQRVQPALKLCQR